MDPPTPLLECWVLMDVPVSLESPGRLDHDTSSYTEDHTGKAPSWELFWNRSLIPPHSTQWPRSEDILRGTDTQPCEATGQL